MGLLAATKWTEGLQCIFRESHESYRQEEGLYCKGKHSVISTKSYSNYFSFAFKMVNRQDLQRFIITSGSLLVMSGILLLWSLSILNLITTCSKKRSTQSISADMKETLPC